MTSRLSDLLDTLPSWAFPAASVLATVFAATGAGLLTLAAIYGDTTPALWGGAAFGLSALLWHLADHGH